MPRHECATFNKIWFCSDFYKSVSVRVDMCIWFLNMYAIALRKPFNASMNHIQIFDFNTLFIIITTRIFGGTQTSITSIVFSIDTFEWSPIWASASLTYIEFWPPETDHNMSSSRPRKTTACDRIDIDWRANTKKKCLFILKIFPWKQNYSVCTKALGIEFLHHNSIFTTIQLWCQWKAMKSGGTFVCWIMCQSEEVIKTIGPEVFEQEIYAQQKLKQPLMNDLIKNQIISN